MNLGVPIEPIRQAILSNARDRQSKFLLPHSLCLPLAYLCSGEQTTGLMMSSSVGRAIMGGMQFMCWVGLKDMRRVRLRIVIVAAHS